MMTGAKKSAYQRGALFRRTALCPQELEKKHDVEKGDYARYGDEGNLIPRTIGKSAHHFPGRSEKDE